MVRFSADSEAGKALQKHVQAKLQTEEYLGQDFTDDSLSMYITTLLSQVTTVWHFRGDAAAQTA